VYIPEYTTVAAALSDGLVAGDTFVLNGASGHSSLRYLRSGLEFEYPGRSDGAAALALPYRFRDANVVTVFEGGEDSTKAPNLTWGWTQVLAGTGTETTAGAATIWTDPTAASIAHTWINNLGLDSTKAQLLYAHIRNDAGSATAGSRIILANGARRFFYTLSYGGASGSFRHEYTPRNNAYVAGSGVWEEVLLTLDPNAKLSTVARYQTGDIISAVRYLDLGATATNQILIGSASAADTGTTRAQGFPALALLEER